MAKQDVLWRTLEAYIGMWGEQVDIYSPRISELIDEVGAGLASPVWLATCRAALAADAPDDLVHTQARRWASTWDALASWFGGRSGQARLGRVRTPRHHG